MEQNLRGQIFFICRSKVSPTYKLTPWIAPQYRSSLIASSLLVSLSVFALAFLIVIQINRCYSLWKNKNIIIAPIAMLVVGTGMSAQ